MAKGTKSAKAVKVENVAKLRALVSKATKAAQGEESALRELHAQYIAPLQTGDGFIAPEHRAMHKAITKAVKVYVTDWYLAEPRVIDGAVYQPDTLRAEYAKGSGDTFLRADRAINVKVWRYVNLFVARKPKGETGAAGKVATALARSKAAKGKGGAKAAKPATELGVPQLAEQMGEALRRLSPQSRIVQATAVLNMMRDVVNEARAAIDAQPVKPAKPRMRRGAKVAAPAPVAVQ